MSGKRLTSKQMEEAVAEFLSGTVPSLKQVQVSSTITETIPETPMLQIYTERREGSFTNTDRASFGGRRGEGSVPVRVKRTTIHVDVYARQRSSIGEDLAAVRDLTDAIEEALDETVLKPYFGLEQVESFKFYWERVTFEYGTVKYAGSRFYLDLVTM